MKTLFNQRGFSMVEVMVAMGLLGVLGYGLMKFTETSGLQQQKMTFNQGLNSFTNSIQTELAKKENCSASLMNLASGAHINEIKEGDKVEFELQNGKKGMNAVNVTVIG